MGRKVIVVLNNIKVGIIGQGRSGRDIHAFSLGKMADRYQIMAVSDLLEARRERAIRELGCDAYADYREMFIDHQCVSQPSSRSDYPGNIK